MEPKAAVSLEGPDQKSPPTGVETPKVVLSLVARPHFLCAETSLPVCREGDGVTAQGLASRIGQVQNAGVLDCTPCDFCGDLHPGKKDAYGELPGCKDWGSLGCHKRTLSSISQNCSPQRNIALKQPPHLLT